MKKIYPENKKKGDVFIWSLLVIFHIFLFLFVFLYFINSVDNYSKVDYALETVGKTRVQAIDVPMKEQFGHIEVMHKGYDVTKYEYMQDTKRCHSLNEEKTNSNCYPYRPDYSDVRTGEITPGYAFPVLKQNDPAYISAVERADDIAKETGVISIQNRFKNFKPGESNEDSFIDINKDNICIEVFPLPKGESGTLDLSCTVKIDGQDYEISVENVTVNGLDHPLSINTTGTQEAIENKDLRIYNGVFVGFAYKDTNSMFFRFFKDFIDESDAPIRQSYRVVYPQIDAHSFGSEDNW